MTVQTLQHHLESGHNKFWLDMAPWNPEHIKALCIHVAGILSHVPVHMWPYVSQLRGLSSQKNNVEVEWCEQP